MRDRNLVGGGPVVATTKRRKKKKRHLESGRKKRSIHPGWRCTRAGAPAKSGNRRLDVEQEEDDEEESEEEWSDTGGRGKKNGSSRPGVPSSTGSAYNQLDWTVSRVFVVRPRVVGATTGAGVGLPLLLLVVAVLGNQTRTTTAAPVVSDTYVSLDATPPRLLPRLPDRSPPESTYRRTTRRFSNLQPGNPFGGDPPSSGALDYHEVSSLELGLDGVWSQPLDPTGEKIDINVNTRTKDPTSSSPLPGEEAGRGGRGGGGLAHERTESKRRQVAASLLDQRHGSTTSLSQRPSYWLQTALSRNRRLEDPLSTLVETGVGLGRSVEPVTKDDSSDPEDSVRSRDASSTVTTAPAIARSIVPYRPVARTAPRVFEDEEKDRRNRKDERRGVAGKHGGKFAVAGNGSGEVIGGGGGGVVEWTTTTVAGPMSSWSYHPEDEEPGAGSVRTPPSPEEEVASEDEEADGAEDQVKVIVAQPTKGSTASTTARPTTTTTQLPPPSQDTSMEALSASSYIVSVVLVLVVGALVGVLATVSHHLHHRRLLLHEPASASILHHHRHHHHRHHREELPASHQRRLLLQDHRRHPGTPMLSVSPGMEVGSGGHGGLGGGLEGDPSGGGAGVGGVGGGGGGGGGEGATDGMQEAMVAAARDRAIRAGSVRQDLALDLPPRLQLPDGEERPYGAHTALHLRDPEQESEIYQKCVRPPPNRTVFDSESPPPYRSQSALLDAPDRIVRCHSAGSSLLRVFRKFPSPGSSTPAVVVPPRRPTLSSYSESSSNLSNLSSLTVVPCETDESQQQQHHHHHQQHV
ncbi:uncharacterized protein LOC143209271 [Lasioglossum baleicum]|uniref:uncharacterized protein LOC143209271 n=1 Tax=Lasioglossum baleicum TaxID=434251 RepID=UPI003FCE368F